MSFEPIFRDAVSGVAGVTVYDKGANDILGRYCVAKSMKLPNGKVRTTQKNYIQRPAALNYARKFLRSRASMVGKTYEPGDGKNTLAYCPLNTETAATIPR